MPVILNALRQAGPPETFRGRPRDEDPWRAAWSEIVHQGTVYTASYAAVPHLVAMCRGADERVRPWLLDLVARVEIGRAQDEAADIPRGLKAPYLRALEGLRGMLADCMGRRWDGAAGCRIAGAFLVINGLPALGEFVMQAPVNRPVDPDSQRDLFPAPDEP